MLFRSIERLADSPYRWTTGTAPLEQVANVEKKMPRDFITADGFHITEACRRYLLPLIAGEDYPPYADGLPLHTELANTAVPRQLPPRRL